MDKSAKVKYDKNREQIHQTMSDLAKLAVGIAVIITLPFRIVRWCVRTFENSKAWFTRKSNTTPEVV
jgi:hypothetical protein